MSGADWTTRDVPDGDTLYEDLHRVLERSLVDVIAEAIGHHDNCSGDDCCWCESWRRDLAAAVVARCQGLTVEQQAELIGGDVILRRRAHDVVERAVGPWIEDPS